MLCLALASWKETRPSSKPGARFTTSSYVYLCMCHLLIAWVWASQMAYLICPNLETHCRTDSNRMARRAWCNVLPPFSWYCPEWRNHYTTTIWAQQLWQIPNMALSKQLLRSHNWGPGTGASPWDVSERSPGWLSCAETREPGRSLRSSQFLTTSWNVPDQDTLMEN